jgi:hypothetical protein
MTDKEFVLSIYPDAEFQLTPAGFERLVSEPTEQGFWISKSRTSFKNCFDKMKFQNDDVLWADAAELIRTQMVRKLEQ